MLKYPQRPSENCILREQFFNADYCRDNGTTIVGGATPANGLPLNGSSQYATRNLNDCVLNGKTALTFEAWFSPSFAADDGVDHYLWDTTSGAGVRIAVIKSASNALTFVLGNTSVVSLAFASYSAYWNVNKPNHLVYACVSGSTICYLNNNLITTSATAWAQTVQPATFVFGAANTLGFKFAGTIHSFSIYSVKWSAEEVSDAYNKCTFTEMAFSKAVVHLPCKSIYANTGDGTMLGSDMSMEAADTSAWTAVTSAVLSKETGTRTGGSGTKVLRITGANSLFPEARQTILTANKYYRVTGWCRGDGTTVPRFYCGNTYFAGTSSATWQYIDTVMISTGAALTWRRTQR
jgi:hypothetical protein